jgi:apolipoprotein N-acyltransferase
MMDNCPNKKSSFWMGFSFGFGYFVLGLYWISISLFTDFAKFGWLLPFSVTLIPAAMALYIGLTTFICHIIFKELTLDKTKKLLLFSIIWLGMEWLRSILFTGFPWNLIGYNLGFSDRLIQISSLVGIYGLGFLSITVCTVPALFLNLNQNKLILDYNRKNSFSAFTIIILFFLSWIYGTQRLKNATTEFVENGNLRLVQPNIRQDQKWDPESHYESFVKNITLTNSKNSEKINYVIWSESAVSYIINQDNYKLLDEISQAAPKGGFVITGGLRAQFENNDKSQIDKIWNSVFAIDSSGKIAAYYDKTHLVPFGEYIPFQRFLPFLSKITDGGVGFSSGEKISTIKLSDNLPGFRPLVCYEIIFTDNIIDKNNPPQFLINVTNDAWFGNSSGPYQHLAMAKIRAVEYGLPIARVANSGISALIDPYGRIIKKLDLNQSGILDVQLMKNLKATFYSQYGKNILSLLLFLILFFCLV